MKLDPLTSYIRMVYQVDYSAVRLRVRGLCEQHSVMERNGSEQHNITWSTQEKRTGKRSNKGSNP